MKNFCYWQEDIPETNIEIYKLKQQQKICLLRLNEYKISKENNIKNNISIFCPYSNGENILKCNDYSLIKDIK